MAKGIYIVGILLEQQGELRVTKIKTNAMIMARPGQHHFQVVHLEMCIKEKDFLLPWQLFHFNREINKKYNSATL